MKGSTPVKRVVFAVPAILALVLLAACGTNPSEPTPSASPSLSVAAPVVPMTINIASLKGPTTMGLVKLIDDASKGTAAEDYQATVYGTPDEVIPLVVQGKLDIALIPANLAAVLYNKTKGTDAQVSVVAVNTLGVLNVVEVGDTIHSIADLKGRTIYSTGKGASPEYVLNYLLTQNGLTPGVDVTVEFKSEATEVTAALAAEPGAVGVLPQPYVTIVETKVPGARTALDFTKEWAKVNTDSQLVTGVVVIRNAFATEHPDAVAQFLKDYAASTAFTNEHPADAAPLIVSAGIVPSPEIAVAAIPFCNIVDITGAEMKTTLGGYLAVLFGADPKSVGGSLPGDDFYYGG
jgi:NitT/TauT family transport system substrate-binding protein